MPGMKWWHSLGEAAVRLCGIAAMYDLKKLQPRNGIPRLPPPICKSFWRDTLKGFFFRWMTQDCGCAVGFN